MARNRCRKPFRLGDLDGIQRMTRLTGKLFEVVHLGAAVPLAEGVDVVDIADDHRRLLRERRGGQPFEEARPDEPAVHVRHAGLDVAAKLELLAALADLDRAQLTGPVVNVLEQMAVDRAKVREVEGTAQDALRLRSTTSPRSCLSRKSGSEIPSRFLKIDVPG